MIEVLIARAYSIEDAGEMRWWCHKNAQGAWSTGCPSATILGTIVDEIPWTFSDQRDATLFLLTWA